MKRSDDELVLPGHSDDFMRWANRAMRAMTSQTAERLYGQDREHRANSLRASVLGERTTPEIVGLRRYLEGVLE